VAILPLQPEGCQKGSCVHKTLAVILLIFSSSIPALAKPHDVYPVSCDVLWAAVKDTLGNQNDFSVIAIDEAGQKASFVVVGETTPYRDMVALAPRDNQCAMKLTILQVGSDNSDERVFRKRLGRSLVRVQAAMPAKPAGPQGQQ
jgi:hypothetical protein